MVQKRLRRQTFKSKIMKVFTYIAGQKIDNPRDMNIFHKMQIKLLTGVQTNVKTGMVTSITYVYPVFIN